MSKEQQSRLKELITRGREQGYLTYAEVNDHLPSEIVDPEQIEDIIGMINGMGIDVHEVAPDAETLLLADGNTGNREVDDTAAEEAAAALSALDTEGGRTTDPVRMYMREMGSVELLTREGEIEIAKRIEGGLQAMMLAISASPTTIVPITEPLANATRKPWFRLLVAAAVVRTLARTATLMRQRAIAKSSGWYRPLPPCSMSTSLPAMPRSAAPYCT